MSDEGHNSINSRADGRSSFDQEKGRVTEAARPRKTNMDTIVQERPAGNGSTAISYSGESENKKLGIWLDKLVTDAAVKGKPVVQMVKLTPAIAEMLLDRNPANRKVNKRLVDAFASDIAGHRWSLNGEPIIISDTGELNDGQHRCQAVVDAGRTIDVIMVVGVSRESRSTLDQGRMRSIGDYLAMDGHVDGVVLGAAAGYLWIDRNRGQIYTGGVTGGKFGATKSEVRQMATQNPGLARSVAIAGMRALPVGGRALVAFCHFVLVGQNREAADQFIHSLMDGAGLKANDPILYARNRLINERGRIRAPEKAELIFRAWNAWRRGDRISRLPLQGGVLPVLEA